ncbi:unnamed protein product [Camellia sinensis]
MLHLDQKASRADIYKRYNEYKSRSMIFKICRHVKQGTADVNTKVRPTYTRIQNKHPKRTRRRRRPAHHLHIYRGVSTKLSEWY